MSTLSEADNRLDSLPAARAARICGFAIVPWFVRFFRDPVGCLLTVQRRHGPLLALGGLRRNEKRQYVIALGPTFNEQILGDNDLFITTGQSFTGPKDSAMRRIRHGLTRMRGEKHQQQRKLINPLLTKQAVDGYCDDIVRVVAGDLECWPVGGVIDAYLQMRRLALMVSSQTLFGREAPEQADFLGRLIGDLFRRTFSAPVWLCPVNLPGTPYRRMLGKAEAIERTLLDMIERRRKSPSAHTDILERLALAFDDEGMRMTTMELVGQATVLFAASYETMASSLTWMLLLLAQHPSVTRALLDELDSELAGDAPTAQSLPRLKLLERVIKESLRILPPVVFLSRRASGPALLGDLPLTQGDRIITSPYITHHLPQLYPDPQRFIPERWFSIKPGPYEYLPFGAGPRYCAGAAFAMTALKITLAMMLQRFRLSPAPGLKVDRVVRITMTPRGPVPMTVHQQDRAYATVPLRGQLLEMVDFPRV